jgi:transcriptional regulator with PAS, ATPase and Fis domain
MLTNFQPKNAKEFICECCDFKCSKLSNYKTHISTRKHKILTNVDKNNAIDNILEEEKLKFKCACGKIFSYRQSLFVHKKKCNVLNGLENLDKGQPLTTDLVLELIQQNKKLQEMLHDQHNKMYEIAKEGKTITNNNTTNNNNQFNLNFFLNEQCKDALNLMDFVDSLNVKLKDLEYTATKGYAEGISNIFITALSDLNVHKRPIHCSDSKREILYIKENGEWQKEDDEKSKLTKAIKIIGNKSMKQISEWQKAYPEYNDPSSKQNDKYMKMLCNAMSGSTKEEAEKNYDKIIRNIAKEVIIDKSL